MKFYVESYVDKREEKKITIEIPDDSDIYDVMDTVNSLLVALSFHQNSIFEGCKYLLEQYKDIDKSETN